MAYVPDDQLQAARQWYGGVASELTAQRNELDELKSRPYRDQVAAEVQSGWRQLRDSGWSEEDRAGLQRYMEMTGTALPQVAVKSYPHVPSTRGFLLNRVESAERDALLNQDYDTYDSLAITRVLAEERGW